MNTSGKRFGWQDTVCGNVLMLGVVSLFTDISSEMIYPLLPIFFTGFMSASTAAVYIGLMDGIAESASSLIKIYSGRLSDVLGKRKALAVIGYGISTLSRPLMALAAAGWHIITLRFCDRVGKGIRTSPRDALISDSAAPNVRGLAFSFHRAMDHAGAVTGPLLAALILYAFLGYGLWQGHTEAATPDEMRALRWLFGIALIPGLAAMAALILKVREIPPDRKAKTDDLPWETQGRLSSLPTRFYFYLGTVTLFTLGNSSDLFLIFYAKTRFHLGLGPVIGLWVTLHVSKIIFSLPGGILSDKLGRRLVIVAGWIIYVLVYAGMSVVAELWLLWVLFFAYGIYYGMTEGAERALVADHVPSEQRGRAYGLYHGAVGLAALPASFLFGVFWMKLGPEVAFMIGASLAAAATLLLTILLPGRQASGPAQAG